MKNKRAAILRELQEVFPKKERERMKRINRVYGGIPRGKKRKKRGQVRKAW